MANELVVSYKREGDKHEINTHSVALGTLNIDYADVPADARGGTAKQLLASSALYCFCSALSGALEARGGKYNSITGTATLETGLDDKKRARVTGIKLEVTVDMPEEYDFIFDRCEKIMQQGCLVTASLEQAFPVTYKLHHEF